MLEEKIMFASEASVFYMKDRIKSINQFPRH